ncbi:MAG: YegP family protein [Candidatus Geothermarchaeales archaeon]
MGVGRTRRARPKFEIFRDETGEFRFRLKAPNGEIIGVSEGYKSKGGCKGGIESVKRNAPAVAMVDLTEQP